MTEVQKSTDSQTPSGVAVIAIHGVGDPTPGSTGQAVARLLVSQAGYTHQGSDTWLVPVEAVHENSVVAPCVQGRLGGLGSLAASPFTQSRLQPEKAHPDSHAHDQGDLGIQLNYHLLRGTVLSNAEKVYTAHRQRLEKNDKKVDVLDLYWGDLSGLSNAVTQILTELYAMVFHLCQLGRDAAQYTAIYMREKGLGKRKGTSLLADSHVAADFLFTKPAGLLNVLALVLCLWWLPLRLVSDQMDMGDASTTWRWLLFGALVISGLVAMGVYSYRDQTTKSGWRLGITTGVVVLSFWLITAAIPTEKAPHVFACAWLLVILVVYVAFLRFSEDSNRGVIAWGVLMAGALVIAMASGAWRAPMPDAGWAAHRPHLVVWMYSVLTAVELVLVLMLVVWTLIAAAMAGFVAAGIYLGWRQHNRVVRQGIVTGRIGFFVSILLFLCLTSVAWVLVQSTIAESFQWLEYKSLILEKWRSAQHLQAAQPAHEYIEGRFKDSTRMFAPLAGLLAITLLGAIVVLFPSIRAEIKHPKAQASGEYLGRWLGQSGVGYTSLLNYTVVVFCALFLGVMAVVDFQLLASWLSAAQSSLLSVQFVDEAAASSQSLLQAMMLVVGGSAIGLVAVGTKIFGAVGNIRLALDAALDVDRHFREFPDQSAPRGRIAARLKSVLQAAGEARYERIVICAHSQGTVIVAELLRYLRERDPAFMNALPEIHLFTCGSPLRQLYAARFPALYEWLEKPLPEAANTTGPHADMLGVKRWTNAYSTGDYVGRWLWMPQGVDLLAFSEAPNWKDSIHRQICLGKGAHTHYYDTNRATVATEIDKLIF